MTDYSLYESMKSDWIRNNPKATHQQYESAMRAIAKRCGV